MKVLLLASSYLGVGGVEAYTRLLGRAMLAAGADIEVLSLLGGEMPVHEAPGRYLGHRGSRPRGWTYARLLSAALGRGRRYDLVLCGHVSVLPIGMALHEMFRVPYVGVAHGIDVWGPVAWPRQSALRRADRMIAVSRFTAGMLAEVHGVPRDRIAVVHPVPDSGLVARADRMRRRSDAAPVTLLTVARLVEAERYKGCDSVIRVLPQLRASSGAVRYVIVGDGDDRARLEGLARDTGVADAVAFRGYLTGDDLAVEYQNSDVFVMPSVTERRRDGWTGEGFGIVYVEAAAFGLPVVAGSGGGAPEAVRDGLTGFVLDGRDARALANALARLARDPMLRAQMGEAGRQWVREHFTFERFRREIEVTVTGVTGAAAPA
jgi:phosphatidylinositol alpha-1,6-mannosyltransferase